MSEIEKALAEAVKALAAARNAVCHVARAYGDADEDAMARGDAKAVRYNAYVSGQCDDQAVVIESVARHMRFLRKTERRHVRR